MICLKEPKLLDLERNSDLETKIKFFELALLNSAIQLSWQRLKPEQMEWYAWKNHRNPDTLVLSGILFRVYRVQTFLSVSVRTCCIISNLWFILLPFTSNCTRPEAPVKLACHEKKGLQCFHHYARTSESKLPWKTLNIYMIECNTT